jgi:ribosomal protein S1
MSKDASQWASLEEHYINNKPIVARILEITKGCMLVDVGGIQGCVEHFSFGFTTDLLQTTLDEVQLPTEQSVQQRWIEMKGKEILLNIVEMDKENNNIKLSQRSYKKDRDFFEKIRNK